MGGLSTLPSAIFIDSEAPILRAMQRTLRKLKDVWDIHFYEDGNQAAERLAEIEPWIVIADSHALRENEAFHQALKLYGTEALRVLVTAYRDERVLLDGARCAHFILAKPYDPQLLFHIFDTAKALHQFSMSDQLRSCLGSLKGLPLLPDYYYRIAKELDKAQPDVEIVADIIHEQPAILVKLLQIANSAFFGYTKPAITAQEVVMRLGLDMVRSLVLFSGLFKVDEDVEDARVVSELAAEAMSVCGVIGQIADAMLVNRRVRGELLLAGLVHNIGKLVNLRCRCNGSSASQDYEQLTDEYEVAGAFLLCLWDFSFSLVSAVKHQNSEQLVDEAGLVEQVLNAALMLRRGEQEPLQSDQLERFSDKHLKAALVSLS